MPLSRPDDRDDPAPAPLVDRFGRIHTDLRVSLTDRCNLRCTYCMPAEGLEWLPRAELLTDDEVVRLLRVGTQRLGISEVRLTGGESLLRRGLPRLVARLSAVEPAPELSITTNGIGLARTAGALREAGLSRINVSLDTLRPARAAGLDPVKVNAVPVRGVNDDEIADLAAFAAEHGYHLRFIESMPLDAQGAWDREQMVRAQEILERLGERFELVPVGRQGNAPAEEWRIAGADTVVGVIASVTRPFCGSCDRVRLTADGRLRNCLFATEESDLRSLLRGGADDSAQHGTVHRHGTAAPAMMWSQARAVARDSAGQPLPAVARTLPEALGHTLAEPLRALTDLPPFDAAAMDGWAVAGPGPWQLHRGGILAGGQGEPLDHGTAVPIATGARLPPGATAVLRYEHGELQTPDGVLHAPDPPAPGRDIRPHGQECRHGDTLLPAGTTVTPAVLGLAAAAGYDRLAVRRRPTVELLVLGNELLDSGLPAEGRVRDALGPMLPAWLRSGGGEVIGVHRVVDDLGPLSDALRRSPADVVVTTGSTAAGPVDFLHGALAEAGARLLVDSVAVRPGHPMLLAELPPTADGRARRLVGLPGNPLAAVAGTVTLALPLLGRLAGRVVRPRRVTAAVALPGRPRDTRLQPVRLAECTAVPLAFDGPAMLRGLALADGLAVVPPGGAAAGADVEVLEAPGRDR